MDSVTSFEDDYFEDLEEKNPITTVSKSTTKSYVPKQCPPQWFQSTDSNHSGDELCSVLKFQADSYYSKGEYQLALEHYERVLPLLSKTNITFQRDCLEGIARSWVKLGTPQNGLECVKKLAKVSKTTAQLCAAFRILASIHQATGNTKDEILTLHNLLLCHTLSTSFWLQLARAYAVWYNISLCHLSTVIHKEEKSERTNDLTKHLNIESSSNIHTRNHRECAEPTFCDEVNFDPELSELEPWSLGVKQQFDVKERQAVFIVAACLIRISTLLHTIENNSRFLNYRQNQRLLQQIEEQLCQLNLPPNFLAVAKESLSKDVRRYEDDGTQFEDLSKLETQEEEKSMENSSSQFEKQWFGWIHQFL